MKNNNIIENNYSCMKKVDRKYEELVDNIVLYIRGELTEEDSEEAINDILDILLEAQERKEDLHKVVGDDFKKFCDNFIEVYKEESKFYFFRKLKELLSICIKMFPFFLALNIFEKSPREVTSFSDFANYSYNFTISPILRTLFFGGISYWIVYLISKESIISKKSKRINCYIGVIFSVSIVLAILGEYVIKLGTIISIPNYIFCYILSIIILIIYTLYSVKLYKSNS